MSKRKFSSAFKTKVVLEALQERHSATDLAQKYQLHPQQISKWKKDFLAGASSVFDQKSKSVKSESEQERDRLLKAIGELKMENDF